MQQLEATDRVRPPYVQRLRRATEEYVYRVRSIAVAQCRAEASRVDTDTKEQHARRAEAA